MQDRKAGGVGEAWELDWLENMQDPTDGGVFGVIRPRNGGYEQFMPPAEAKRSTRPAATTSGSELPDTWV